MKKCHVYVFTLILVALHTFIPTILTAQDIEKLARNRVEYEETPGIVVGVFENGKPSFYAHGVASTKTKQPVNAQTVFEIGSISKVFTTTLLAFMIEEGKVTLSDTVQKLLPDEVKMPVRNDRVITIGDLATIRSGLPRMPGNFAPVNVQNPYIDYTSEKLYAFLSSYELTRDIGSKYEYSNLGIGLLGHTLTRVSGKSYQQMIQEMIVKPLKLTRTGLNTPDQKTENKAAGHVGNVVVPDWTWTDESVMAPAGGLYASAEDLITFLAAQFSENGSRWNKAVANARAVRAEAGPGMDVGLGWHIKNKTIVWHNGGTGGFRTFAGFDPEKKKAVVVLTNSIAGADDLGFHLLDNSIPLKELKDIAKVSEAILKRYTGTYELTPFFKITVTTEDGSLYAQATGQGKFEIYPESETKFFYKVVDAQIEFKKDSKGKVEKLILYQNGAEQPAKKVE